MAPVERFPEETFDQVYAVHVRGAFLLAQLAVPHMRRGGSIVITSNRGFEAWGEILGDAMVAAALIDRLVHHATMVTLKGKSYRLRERGTSSSPQARPAPVEN